MRKGDDVTNMNMTGVGGARHVRGHAVAQRKKKLLLLEGWIILQIFFLPCWDISSVKSGHGHDCVEVSRINANLPY